MLIEWLKKRWAYVAAGLGAILVSAAIYLSGRSLRKGDVEIGVAKRELENANRTYNETLNKTHAIQEKSKRLVSDILVEQNKRAEDAKRVEGLSDEEVVSELRKRGDITD